MLSLSKANGTGKNIFIEALTKRLPPIAFPIVGFSGEANLFHRHPHSYKDCHEDLDRYLHNPE